MSEVDSNQNVNNANFTPSAPPSSSYDDAAAYQGYIVQPKTCSISIHTASSNQQQPSISNEPPSAPQYGAFEETVISIDQTPMRNDAEGNNLERNDLCPVCQNDTLVASYPCLALCCAIALFPIGIICCLALKNKRCPSCDTEF